MNLNKRSLLIQLSCFIFLFLSFFSFGQTDNHYTAPKNTVTFHSGDPLRALYECNSLLKKNAKNKDALFRRAIIKTELGAYHSAQNDFTQALNFNHSNKVEIYYRRGITYFLENDFLNAITDFDSAISIQPNHVDALWKKAQSYYHIGARSLTLESLDQISIIQPNDPIIWHDMGTLYYKNKELNKAKDCFTRAIIIDPKMSVSYNHRGIIFENLKDAAKAFDDYNKAIFYDSCFVEAYNNRGLIYLQFEDYYEAENDFTTALNKDLHLNKEALNNLAITKYLTGRPKDGLEDINNVIQHYPFFAMAYITRGNIKERLHDDAGACSDWHKAAELGLLTGLEYAQETCQ
ncbi:tetratricopeptide repeat protein [Flammeovirga pacifica]|uniref:Uncharacterized protein n=1 Tax=Flammeovirga pacifica TaxID=915059 RepID=A0A1S1YYL3_FLAPC|nr:tetratricopeptide repeat protein [Flammeovirga pacifica]OHX65965.1 hypothetical protein NH26_06180 [Flammeovirga pacifica]